MCPLRVRPGTRDAGRPYPCHFINTPVPPAQHCLACLEGACSKGCNHCQCSSVERASLRLVSTLSHQGHWQGPVAQFQCLVTSTCMCGISNFTSTEPNVTKELRGIEFRTFHCSPSNKNIPKNRLLPGLAADFFSRDGTPVASDSKFERQCCGLIACARREIYKSFKAFIQE